MVIIDPHDQVVFEQNADLPFVSASLYKLVFLAEILGGVETGELDARTADPISSDYYLVANGEDSYLHTTQSAGHHLEEWSIGRCLLEQVGAQALMALTSPEQLDSVRSAARPH